jgi:hypothetical protein
MVAAIPEQSPKAKSHRPAYSIFQSDCHIPAIGSAYIRFSHSEKTSASVPSLIINSNLINCLHFDYDFVCVLTLLTICFTIFVSVHGICNSGPCPSARFDCCARQHPGHAGQFTKPMKEGVPGFSEAQRPSRPAPWIQSPGAIFTSQPRIQLTGSYALWRYA